MADAEILRKNIIAVNDNIAAALARAERSDGVTVVGASKTMPREVIETVNDNKLLKVLGENRVQELTAKCDIRENIEWHMIGTLQTNKVKFVVGNVSLIESLDRDRLAAAIDAESSKRGIVSDCLIQVNMGREESKSGYFPEEIRETIKRLKKNYRNIEIRGLMAVMPKAEEVEIIELYKQLRKIFKNSKDEYGLELLSAGMTNDYSLAVEFAHSNIVRIGRAIFGERSYNNEKIGDETQTDK